MDYLLSEESRVNNSEEYICTLSELGLSISQAKVYLSLVKTRNLRAHEISQVSGISRPDVYRVLIQLEDAGLVEKTISKPEEFHAISVEQCVSKLMQKRIKKTLELQQKSETLVQNFKRKIENDEIAEKFQFMLIANRDGVYAKAAKMIRSLQETFCALLPRRRLIAWVSIYSPILEEALTRKVDFRIIMPKPDVNEHFGEPFEVLMKHPNFNLRFISGFPNVVFTVWDQKETLISTSAVDTPFPQPTLWSNNQSVVDLSQDYFDLIWQKAQKTKIEKRKMVMEEDLVS